MHIIKYVRNPKCKKGHPALFFVFGLELKMKGGINFLVVKPITKIVFKFS